MRICRWINKTKANMCGRSTWECLSHANSLLQAKIFTTSLALLSTIVQFPDALVIEPTWLNISQGQVFVSRLSWRNIPNYIKWPLNIARRLYTAGLVVSCHPDCITISIGGVTSKRGYDAINMMACGKASSGVMSSWKFSTSWHKRAGKAWHIFSIIPNVNKGKHYFSLVLK